MDVNIITIKFKDGSNIYIDDVSDYAINNNVVKVNKNGYNQFFNFDEVRYIGRTFDLEPEIYNAMKRWDNENKKKHLTYARKIKTIRGMPMKQYEADQQRKLFQWTTFIRTEYPEVDLMFHIQNCYKKV